MIRIKAVIGICALCALAMSAIGVQSAASATKGTTGFTCKKKAVSGGAGFSKAHCAAADAVTTGAEYEHVAIAENLVTEGRVTNTNTAGELVPARLVSVQAGVEEEFQATKTVGEASGNNAKAGSGEHFIEGTGKTTYSGVTVTKPAGKGCKVKGGEITTKLLKGTSLEQGMEGKLEPAEGTIFTEFTVEGCTIAALNGLYAVSGLIRCPTDGATVSCTHAATTAQGTLKLRGQKAGIEVTTTVTGKAPADVSFTPLSATTVETP